MRAGFERGDRDVVDCEPVVLLEHALGRQAWDVHIDEVGSRRRRDDRDELVVTRRRTIADQIPALETMTRECRIVGSRSIRTIWFGIGKSTVTTEHRNRYRECPRPHRAGP